ncbi:MAG TPA: secretin and TonB N-terminal domain-containing protein, partial [Methylocystis sp.]|nr:secretin and TonB N-terminal domain-containing protein [Methylocystis sp.]
MGATTILAAAGAVAFSANAQSVSAHARIPDQEISAATRSYDIPPGLVSTALNRLADESGVRIIYDAALTRSLTTPGLKGRHTLPGALALLLAGTGLKYEVSQDGRSALILLAQAGGAANDAVPLGATALPTIEVGAAQPTSGQGTPSDQGQGGAAATSGDQSSGGAGGGAGGYGGAGAAQDPYNKS